MKWPRSKKGENSEEESLPSDEEGDSVLTLMKAGTTFMEAAFKSKLNAPSRKKKMTKLGTPDCKWTKSPKLGSFITSTIPKEVVQMTSPSCHCIDKTDAGEILEGKLSKASETP